MFAKCMLRARVALGRRLQLLVRRASLWATLLLGIKFLQAFIVHCDIAGNEEALHLWSCTISMNSMMRNMSGITAKMDELPFELSPSAPAVPRW